MNNLSVRHDQGIFKPKRQKVNFKLKLSYDWLQIKTLLKERNLIC